MSEPEEPSALIMLGDSSSAVCVDGVCEVPSALEAVTE